MDNNDGILFNSEYHITSCFVVYVNEEYNTIADRAFKVAQEYVRRNPNLGLGVDAVEVLGNRSDAKGLLEESKKPDSS